MRSAFSGSPPPPALTDRPKRERSMDESLRRRCFRSVLTRCGARLAGARKICRGEIGGMAAPRRSPTCDVRKNVRIQDVASRMVEAALAARASFASAKRG
jgi:hypothetical protein